MSGCTATPPSGDLNPGNLSVSGQRETSNGFTVNGSDVEEDFNNGTAVVPNLDSIQDFKVLTSNFDAEYGNFSGGQVLVTTKSGGNQLPRQRLRIPAQHRARLAQLLRHQPRRLPAQPIRRNLRRPHPQRQDILLPRLPGHQHDPGPGDRLHRRAQPRRPHRQSLRPGQPAHRHGQRALIWADPALRSEAAVEPYHRRAEPYSQGLSQRHHSPIHLVRAGHALAAIHSPAQRRRHLPFHLLAERNSWRQQSRRPH